MRSKIYALITSCLLSVAAYCQSEVQSGVVNILERSVGAPNTATLNRYFDVPVNMATGIPNIQIPLYTIKTGNITVPISLSYHGGGVKVNDPASWVGLGWTLNCGGVVSKQINGMDDYYATTQMPPSQNWLSSYSYYDPVYDIDGDLGFGSMTEVIDSLNSGYAYTHANDLYKLLGRIIQNKYDGEADQYFFSNPEASGMFFYNQQKGQFVTDNISGWKVSKETNTYQPEGGVVLQNKTGTTYSYGGQEKTLTPVYEGSSMNSTNSYISAWYLSAIQDGINDRGVAFYYNTSSSHTISQGTFKVGDYYDPLGMGWYALSQSSDAITRTGTDVTLKEVVFNEGKIQFIQDTAARLDLDGPKALKEIRILDKDSVLRKKFVFTYYYHAARLFLQSVQEIDVVSNSSSYSRPYQFNYDTLSLPLRFSYAQDFYGYYNGKTGNTTSLPTETDTYVPTGLTFANRYVDTNYTKAGVLKQIIYPTGGSLNFQYENNIDFIDTLVGGLRIKRIVNYDSVASKSLVTEYKYTRTTGEGSGTVQSRPKFNYNYAYFSGTSEYGVFKITGNPVYPLVNSQGSCILYDEVEKQDIGDGDTIKSRHYFLNYLNSGNDVPWQTYLRSPDNMGVPYNKLSNLQNFSSLEYRTELYKHNGGQYIKVQTDSIDYGSLNHFKDYIWNVQAAWAVSTAWVVWIDNPNPYAYDPMNSLPAINAYKLFHESLVDRQTFHKVYDDSSHLLQQAVYKTFDSTNGNLKKMVTVSSNGDTLTSYYSYIADFHETVSTDSNNIEINNLLTDNIIGLPVEIIVTRKPVDSAEVVTEAHLYMYRNRQLKKHWKITKELAYSSMTKANADNSGFHFDGNYKLENEIVAFNIYNNPIELRLKDKTQAVIWDKDNILASAVNAQGTEIAATSFETGAKGNWNYTGISTTDPTAPTGEKAHSLDSSSVTDSSLHNNRSYIVSYWSKTGAKSVNGSTTSISGRSEKGWTYYEHKLVNPTSGIVTVSGSGLIDELRLYPVGAQMVTYTYKPLIGISSQCDLNNRVTYYEYDAFGRLSLVRDQDHNIVKKICYNYAGQVENCGLAPICTSCSGDDKKCINGVCETGTKLYVSSRLTRTGWSCTYVYYWSDCTASEEFTESSSGPCDIGTECDIARG